MVTFRIVEGNDDFDWEGFCKDYAEDILTKKEILKKYDISLSQYYKRSKYAQEVTGYRRKKGAKTSFDERYIKKVGEGQFQINKNLNGFRVYCGSYPSLRVAKKVRDELIKCNWNEDTMKELRMKYGNTHKGRPCNQHTGSLISQKALSKFDEFKELYMSGEYSYYEILQKLEFTKHMYTVCLRKLKVEYPTIRKKLVRREA